MDQTTSLLPSGHIFITNIKQKNMSPAESDTTHTCMHPHTQINFQALNSLRVTKYYLHRYHHYIHQISPPSQTPNGLILFQIKQDRFTQWSVWEMNNNLMFGVRLLRRHSFRNLAVPSTLMSFLYKFTTCFKACGTGSLIWRVRRGCKVTLWHFGRKK